MDICVGDKSAAPPDPRSRNCIYVGHGCGGGGGVIQARSRHVTGRGHCGDKGEGKGAGRRAGRPGMLRGLAGARIGMSLRIFFSKDWSSKYQKER